MKARLAIFGITAVLLTAGYLASVSFWFQGRFAEYAQRVDQPSVQYLALVLFLAFVGMAFLPNPDAEDAAS